MAGLFNPTASFIEFNNKQLYFMEVGLGQPVIFIPGWMSDLNLFPYQSIAELKDESEEFKKKFRTIFLHLSNFSKSTFSEKPYTLSDYVQELDKAIRKMGIEKDKVNLVGHSAGGRIVIEYTARYSEKVNKLVLMSAAGLRHRNASQRAIAQAHRYFSRIGIVEPENQEILQQTFINLYNTDLTDSIKKIQVPTLILWGDQDKVMSVGLAQRFHELINNSILEILPGLGHNLNDYPEIYNKIFNFIKNDLH